MKFENSYKDMYGNIVDITENEMEYFHSVIRKFVPVMEDFIGRIIEIENRDHEKMDRKNREALGIYYTNMTESGADNKHDFITIDNYFIHECYAKVFDGVHNIAFSTLEETIAHEIAHALYFRHGKKHREMTERILKMVS